ncbi:MAG TPA: PEGA domain-containing protein, partial [Thermotogota bacterium]|nr:PEGA domain-containing protein [Thermotogota bacterium]
MDGEEKGNLSQGVLLVGQLGEGQHQVQAQGERIEELQTQVRFDGQNQWQTLTLNATPSTRMVVIMTEPPNAVVEWEGKTLPEKTPTSQQVQVGQSVNVRLELEGYKVREEQFRVDQKGPPYRWNVKLYQPTQTTLHIQSEPEGANVNLDGTPVGTTPMQIQLGAGDHQLTLEKEGYHAQQEHINITPEQLWQDQQLRRTLQNITQSIQIRTNVEGATIYIDGEEKGEAPQTQEFAWGSTHTIVAKAEGYHDA